MGSIWTQLWTHLEILLIDSMGSTQTHRGLNAKKKNPINVISIGFSKKLASRRGRDVKAP